jgi:hypothetical protein
MNCEYELWRGKSLVSVIDGWFRLLMTDGFFQSPRPIEAPLLQAPSLGRRTLEEMKCDT